jgi:(R,R)-butanediol dehydrogenase/meso-butanediol dehydrogenase/diacetyl reductase
MRAAVFHGLGKPLAIEEVADPKPGPSDLILRVKGSGICGSDLHAAELPPGLPPGTVMGHEFSGEVMEVGAQVRDRWKVGERVCALPYIACGHCAHCLAGDGTLCEKLRGTGLGQTPGAFAEYVRVGTNETLSLPESVGFDEGATVEPLAVGLHAVRQSGLEPGANVLVIGAGPIGLATALWARFFGARSVVVSEMAPARLELAAKFGATHGIDASAENVGSAFQKVTGARPDILFECVGVPGLLQQCIMLAPARSRIVVVGVCMQPDTIVPGLAILKELALHFVIAYRKRDFEFTLDMLEAERIASRPMITHRVDLDSFPAAFEALKKPATQGKVLLEP